MDNSTDKYIVAIELSSSQAKSAVAVVPQSPYANLEVPKVEMVAHHDNSEFVRYGRIQNMVDAESNSSFVLSKLKNHPSMLGRSITGIYVGLSGLSLLSMRTKAQIALPTPMVIDAEALRKLQLEATKQVPGDKEILAVLPRKFLVDQKLCANPNGAFGASVYGEYTIVMASPVNRENMQRVLEDRMGLKIEEFIITPLAVADMVLAEEEKQLGCMLIDFGHQTTTVSIYKDRALQRIATIPMGGYHITCDIASGLKLTQERAEERKQQVGSAINQPSPSTPEDVKQLNSYLQARLGEIVANVLNQLSSIGYKTSDLPSGIVITGRAAKLQALPQYLKEMTKLDVRLAATPNTVVVNDPDINPADYTSIISIVASVASKPSFVSSVPVAPKPAVTVPEPVAQPQPASADFVFPEVAPTPVPTPAYPEYEDSISDDDILLDDEVADARYQQAQQKKAEALRKKNEKKKQQEQDEDKPGLFGKISKRLAQIMQSGNQNGDNNIYLDDDASK